MRDHKEFKNDLEKFNHYAVVGLFIIFVLLNLVGFFYTAYQMLTNNY